MEYITSIKDERIIEARELTTAKGRLHIGKCLLEDKAAIEWACEAGLEIEHIFVQEKSTQDPIILNLVRLGIQCFIVSEGIIRKIIEANYSVPYVAVAKLPQEKHSLNKDSFIIVLDNVVDKGNLGTICRTAAAFGVKHIVLTDENAEMFHKKTIDASRGRAFALQFVRYASGIDAGIALKKCGYQLVATSPHGKSLQSLAKLQDKPIALLLGNETAGISDELMQLADITVQIPMSSEVESLNVAVAAGISIYELKIRMILTMLTEKITTTLGRDIGVAAMLIRKALGVQLQKVSDLNESQVILLMICACDKEMTLEQAGKDIGVFNEDLDKLLQPLISHTYIQLKLVNNKVGIMITQQGQEVIAQLWPVVERSEAEILHNFSQAEKEQLFYYLKRIQNNCMKMIG